MVARTFGRLGVVLGVLLVIVPFARPAASQGASAIGAMPPRLSYVNGDASFWRPGAQDWAPAQINTPLEPGDQLYTGPSGNLEVQIGARAFVRAWGATQLGLTNHEPDFLQLTTTSGHVSVDLRTVEPGRTVEVDTPHAAFTIETPGYYRLDVTQDQTSFITRRGGRATMTPPGGQPMAIAASEDVVVQGGSPAAVQSYVAPDLDSWDRWNYARTEALLDAVSARYVSPGVYGVDDLDHYGTWRVVPQYGSIWVPQDVPAGWAPYTTGRWVWDPVYSWTWVDTAPWGWAPYHHGRWVFLDGYWAWVPGPIIPRPVYAPALVAFFAAPGIRVQIGSPFVSWVALSWGEPVIPWWGRPQFAGHPWWGGWGGPRVVNNVTVNRTTVVNVNNITVYRNVTVQNAMVAVPRQQFGWRPVQEARMRNVDPRHVAPVRGALPVTADARSRVAAIGPTIRPPDAVLSRRVVATRAPQRAVVTPSATPRIAPTVRAPAPRIVPSPRVATKVAPARPPFGPSDIERERRPEQPRFDERQHRPVPGPVPPSEARRPQPQPPASRPAAPPTVRRPVTPPSVQRPVTPPSVQRVEPKPAPPTKSPSRATPPVEARRLPGQPANRLYPGRGAVAEQRRGGPAPAAPAPSRSDTRRAPDRDQRERGPRDR